MAKAYVKFEIPEEIQNKALEALEIARDTGKVKKGSNEATKAVERNIAQLVLIGSDVEPEEIVMHLPLLCDEKQIPFVYISKQNDIGSASGLEVGSAAAAIVKSGKAKDLVDEIAKQIAALRA
ncbi:50S ribosomal protein L7ae [Methanoculleus sp. Wushi-C6]|jgi:large subunit ribosomal protein L7Ae|uniref:Large ribosomal subunit protein eL8 n=1 Tax=Methanoculleus caldifontis TaxID=2651577 RepID=A0ABU3X0W9_9EURY|nr:50S ribosomal protein L7Ae [Methanoculleus sp. Wushi-C6]MDV2481694.1 50S ribosomal protein L7ae [Methanoculleus sp. Wushi-C6]